VRSSPLLRGIALAQAACRPTEFIACERERMRVLSLFICGHDGPICETYAKDAGLMVWMLCAGCTPCIPSDSSLRTGDCAPPARGLFHDSAAATSIGKVCGA